MWCVFLTPPGPSEGLLSKALRDCQPVFAGRSSAQEKYSIFMRHRYSSCVDMLLELLEHQRHQVAVSETTKKLPADSRLRIRPGLQTGNPGQAGSQEPL